MLRLAVPAPKLSCRFLTRMDSALAMELPNSGRTRVCTLVTLQGLEGSSGWRDLVGSALSCRLQIIGYRDACIVRAPGYSMQRIDGMCELLIGSLERPLCDGRVVFYIHVVGQIRPLDG
jgi:hypothetical protein